MRSCTHKQISQQELRYARWSRNLHCFEQLGRVHLQLQQFLNHSIPGNCHANSYLTIMHSRPLSPSSRHISDCGAPRSLSKVYRALGFFWVAPTGQFWLHLGFRTECTHRDEGLQYLFLLFNNWHWFFSRGTSPTEEFIDQRHWRKVGGDVVLM